MICDTYMLAMKAYCIPDPIPEFKFHPTRKWRIDYAWPDVKLAVEIEGGAFCRGRHTRGAGFVADLEKYDALTEAGWALLRYQPGTRKIDYAQIARVYERLANGK
jgi:very-short-patch-repair endonuclease